MRLSIVTPWAGPTVQDLANDYYAACSGVSEVVTIDNGTPEEHAAILQEMTHALAGVYIRNERNEGFAAANNQGYARATGDIVIFLNSDIAAPAGWLDAVRADVKDGALYGPSLQAQFVAGRHLPYIEGWCIAATRGTWEKIRCDPIRDKQAAEKGYGVFPSVGWLGPWDALAYPGPYWEDNDLCLRALSLGITLVQTAWPVQHKGGRTAGPIMRHGESFARNEQTFTARALAALPAFDPTPTWAQYMQAYHTDSDIRHHLGLLYSLARGNVVELGTRGGVSTAALLAGLERAGGHLWSVDIDERCASVAAGHPLWTFVLGSSTDVSLIAQCPDPIDVLFIDTEHNFEQCSAELAIWAELVRPGGHILLHDPETFPGVRRAIEEFCKERGWPVTFVLPNNGMAVVEVPCYVNPGGVSAEGAAWAEEGA